MLASLGSQLQLLSRRLEAGEQQLRQDTARLERIRGDKAKALQDMADLERRLALLTQQVRALSTEECEVEERLYSEAEEFARVQVLDATIRGQARAYQHYQCSLIYVCGSARDERNGKGRMPFLSPVDVRTLKENRAGRRFTVDRAICGGDGVAMPPDLLTGIADDALCAYNYTILLCREGTVAAGGDGGAPSGGSPLASVGPTVFASVVGELFLSLSDGGGGGGGGAQPPGGFGGRVERFRLGCSVVAVRPDGYTDLLGDRAGAQRRAFLSLPTLDGGDTRAGSDGPNAEAAVVHLRSAEECATLLQCGSESGGASPFGSSSVLLLQLHIETFSTAGDYRQSILRLLDVPACFRADAAAAAAGPGSSSSSWGTSVVTYLSAASTLAAESPPPTGHAASMFATSSRKGGSGEGTFPQRLMGLRSRSPLAGSLAPLLDPVFGGNSKALMVVVVPDLDCAAEPARLDAVCELAQCACLFHSHVRHSAAPFVIPAGVLSSTRELEAVVTGSSQHIGGGGFANGWAL